MRIAKLAIVFPVLGLLLVGPVFAQAPASSDLRQPPGVRQTAFEYDSYLYFAPQNNATESPSDVPVTVPDAACAACAGCDTGCNACDDGCRRACGLPQPCFLQSRGITVGGWLQQGITVPANRPADRFNGVLTFNDRDSEWQVNQAWLYLDRAAENYGCGWAWGGHIDFVYGTDAYFVESRDGLEADWNQTERFYQAAMPQIYLDVAYNDLTIRIGRFFTILGYEVVQAPDNFFYSHAYTFQYGEPFTHTGVLGIYNVSDQLVVKAGVHRGWNNFDDTIGKDSMGFLGGVNWTSANERLELAFAASASEEGAADADLLAYSLVAAVHLTDRLDYVFQHDYGQEVVTGVSKAEWYGVNQYLLYEINPCWSAGARVEWFRDLDGTRVTGVRPSNTLVGSYFPGDFWEVTAGLNWTPRQNVIVRPEVRWDWYDDRGAVVAVKPYDTGDRASQFTFACDFILTY